MLISHRLFQDWNCNSFNQTALIVCSLFSDQTAAAFVWPVPPAVLNGHGRDRRLGPSQSWKLFSTKPILLSEVTPQETRARGHHALSVNRQRLWRTKARWRLSWLCVFAGVWWFLPELLFLFLRLQLRLRRSSSSLSCHDSFPQPGLITATLPFCCRSKISCYFFIFLMTCNVFYILYSPQQLWQLCFEWSRCFSEGDGWRWLCEEPLTCSNTATNASSTFTKLFLDQTGDRSKLWAT